MTLAKKIIIAGGGTGGHIFPAISIANAIKRESPETEILFIGANGKMEMEKVPQAGYAIEGIDIAGFNRSSILKNVGLPFKLIKSFLQVRNHFIRFMPDAVIGVGGYSSFPVLKYAQSRGIPSFIHEANSFAGKSNMLLAKRALAIFTGSSGMEKFFPADRIIVSGNPVRKEILERAISRNEASSFFGLDPEKATVLVVGGSLGAQSINDALAGQIGQLAGSGVQLIWQTGKAFAEKAAELVKSYNGFYASDFLVRMDMAYQAADIVVSRAGAMSVAELAIVGKPVIFVPYPHAAENHQMANAKQLSEKQAALIVEDAHSREKLIPEIISLTADGEKQELLKKNIKAFAITDAAEKVAKEVLQRISLNANA